MDFSLAVLRDIDVSRLKKYISDIQTDYHPVQML